jgi:hypothetical protein
MQWECERQSEFFTPNSLRGRQDWDCRWTDSSINALPCASGRHNQSITALFL